MRHPNYSHGTGAALACVEEEARALRRQVRFLLCLVAYLLFGLALSLMVGCGGWSAASPSGTEQEAHVLAETSRFARALGVDVRGVLTDEVYAPAPNQVAAGWYESGTAYYYRPWVVKQTLSDLTNVAAHEVCHAVSFFHDVKHWECSARVATPTYPRP